MKKRKATSDGVLFRAASIDWSGCSFFNSPVFAGLETHTKSLNNFCSEIAAFYKAQLVNSKEIPDLHEELHSKKKVTNMVMLANCYLGEEKKHREII
mmetsp:Transcript_29629/g.45763  ORF Transcript_29629/g.45763 Transcript_29629/m.45763 type:complete len:97 (-) Transcript_29629:116-406(-)